MQVINTLKDKLPCTNHFYKHLKRFKRKFVLLNSSSYNSEGSGGRYSKPATQSSQRFSCIFSRSSHSNTNSPIAATRSLKFKATTPVSAKRRNSTCVRLAAD